MKEMGEEEEYDLIVSNMNLHWFNDVPSALSNFHNSLVPDGAFISSSLGGDTLQELRICLNLAEQEREGGISPLVSPFLSVTELGNIFAKQGYNLPTIDSVHSQMEFTSTFSLLFFLSAIGEQSSLFEKRKGVMSVDTLIAASAIFETLFTKKTIGQRDETTSSILIDTFKDDFPFEPSALDLKSLKEANSYLSEKLSGTESLSDL